MEHYLGDFMIYLSILTLLSVAVLAVMIRKSKKSIIRKLDRRIHRLREEVASNGSLHLVISIAKCGSSTLAKSLRAALQPHPVHHVHIISKEGMSLAAKTWRVEDSIHREKRLRHLRLAQNARLLIEESRARYGVPVGYYACGVRDPVAIAISGYFQDPESPIDASFSLETAFHEILHGPVLSSTGIYAGGLDGWFDREIRDVLGVDVFEHPFDRDKGYQVIDQKGVRILLIRQEDFRNVPAACSSLYRGPEVLFETRDSNRTQDKAFSTIYSEALANIKFSAEHLDGVYEGRFVRHFYSDEEIRKFRAKWLA